MPAILRRIAGASLLLGIALLSSLPAGAQDQGGLNIQNPYAKPNTLGTTGSKLNEEVTPRSDEYNKALDQIQAGRYDDAIVTLNKLVLMNPTDADALNQLGYCYQKKGEPAKAMGYYKKVLNTKPEHLAANENAGAVLLQMKNLSGAEERLGVLQNACVNCAEYNQLKAMIEAYKLSIQG